MDGMLRLMICLGLGLSGVTLILLAWGRAFSLSPENFSTRRSEAVAIARTTFEELGPISEASRFRTQLSADRSLERRLLQDLSAGSCLRSRKSPSAPRFSVGGSFSKPTDG